MINVDNEKYQGFFKGKTLELRPMTEDNIKTYSKWANDRRNRRLIRIDIPVTFEELRKKWQNEENKEIHFEIWHVIDDKLIGDASLQLIDWRNRNAWVGLRIGEIDYWGKGIGTEVSELILKYGFEELNLHKIYGGIFKPNLGSQKCALKVGMKLEATMDDEVFIDGKYIGTNIYSIFSRDWFTLHPVERK